MRMKKIFSAVLALTVICGGIAPFAAELPEMSLTANAADVVETGKLGDNITYTLDSEGNLTISGMGKMNDYFDNSPLKTKASKIKNVVISDGVLNIGNSVFYKCSSLESITIPNSVASIGKSAFYYCFSLSSITIPESVTSIGERAFAACSSIESITIPDSVTSIKTEMFKDCSALSSVTIPKSVTSIGKLAFNGTKWLDNETDKNPLLIINGILIDGKKCAGDVIIPDSVTSVGDWAFYDCSTIESITIHDFVTSIGEHAFWGCSNLKSVTILNTECELFDSLATVSNGRDKENNLVYNGVIKGYDNSTAQAYAEKYNYKFESLGAAPEDNATESGDLNDDGKIDATDATLVLVNYSLLSTGEKMQLTESQQKAADVNGDGKIDASDATMILQYYSYLSTGGDLVFKEFMKQNG